MNMKTILLVVLILLASIGALWVVQYALNHKATVQIKETSMLPRESIQDVGIAKVASLTRIESDSLARIEDPTLLGLTAGAFNPQFEPLSSSEQATLKMSELQRPELQNMTAGDDNSGVRWSSVLLFILCLAIVF
jgi:hypothetical protein